MSLTSILEAGRRDFLEAVREIPAEQISAKPRSGGWSVLECIEHVVTVENRYLEVARAAEPKLRRNATRIKNCDC